VSLKVKYIIFILVIHGSIAWLIYEVLGEKNWYFFLAEIGIIISLIWSYQLYRSFIRPLEFMASGVDAIRDKDFNIKFVKTGSREMDKLIDVYNDMIDNIRHERTTLQEQHYFLEKLIQASPTGIVMEPDTSKVIALRGTERYKCQSSRFIHQGFERKFILIQELSKEILEAEKKAYAKVIRMMAHEVNNSMGAINSILSSLMEFYKMEDPELDKEAKESLSIAMDRNERLNLFMRNFASVIRLPEPFMEPVSLQKMLSDITRLMAPQAEANQINFELQLPEKEIFAKLDIRQMDQALVNVLKNAIESIGEKGTIRVQLFENPLRIVIEDNGPGLTAETAEQLFSPFFSTKMDGQGIGLTLVKEILMNHNAQFSLRTFDSGWTRFEILF